MTINTHVCHALKLNHSNCSFDIQHACSYFCAFMSVGHGDFKSGPGWTMIKNKFYTDAHCSIQY